MNIAISNFYVCRLCLIQLCDFTPLQAPIDQEFIPIEFDIPVHTEPQVETEPELPQETVEEYINAQGRKMKRIIRRTVEVRTMIINGKPERIEEPREEIYEEPVDGDDQPSGTAVDERIGVMRVQRLIDLPDWEPVEISGRPRRYEPDEPVEPVQPVEEKPAKPVFGLKPRKSEEIIEPSAVDRSYTLPEFDEQFMFKPTVLEMAEPKENTVSVRMHDKENPLTFKITTVKKSRVGHAEAGSRKSNEYPIMDEPNKVG